MGKLTADGSQAVPDLDFEARQSGRDKAAYELAKVFLRRSYRKDVTPELIERYLNGSDSASRKDMRGIYQQILASGQNAERKARMIGGAIGGVHMLGPVLCDFDPALVLESYASEREILRELVDQLDLGNVNEEPKGIWPRYSRTILSGAKFLSQFASAKDFYEWADFFDEDERARPALPMLIEQEIYGFGFPLACDFLKGLGYKNFPKPDVHIKTIFAELQLSPEGANNYGVFKAIVRVALNVGVTPHDVDKLFWLIGSGYFHDNPEIGDDGRIGGRRAEFIAMAGPKLEQMRNGEGQINA